MPPGASSFLSSLKESYQRKPLKTTFQDFLARECAGVAPAGASWGVSCPGTSNFLLLSKESYQRKPLETTFQDFLGAGTAGANLTVCTRGRGAAVITVGQKDCACVHRRGGFRDRLPSHGRGICFYRVGDYQIAPLPPQGGKGRCARWAQDIIAYDTAERIIFTIVAGSGSGKLCWHSRGNDND